MWFLNYVWCSVVQKYANSCKFQHFFTIFAARKRKISQIYIEKLQNGVNFQNNIAGNVPAQYESPSIQIMLMEPSAPLMGSNETFNEREEYDGEWA